MIVDVYALTDYYNVTIKEEFYKNLTTILTEITHRKEVLILSDINARTGSKNGNGIVGRYGYFSNGMIHKYTWNQPTRNLRCKRSMQRQISLIMTTDVRAFRGEERGSDHHMVKISVVVK